MYMREMGTVELLTREGEIAIAKRIEEGLNQVRSSLAAFPMSIELLLEEYEQHLEGKKRLNEVVLGFIDPNAEEEALAAAAAAAEAGSEEHTSELQSLMRISYAVFCLKKKKQTHTITYKDSKQDYSQHIHIK